MIIGYARVSRVEQNLQAQIEALQKAGCELIFEDKLSGKNQERPGLKTALSHLRKGDKLIVCKLDRLGRSLRDLLNILNDFQIRQIEFVSLGDNIDTSTAMGKLCMHVVAVMAEFERDLISERTKFALTSARNNGKKLGRKRKVPEADEALFKDLFCNRKVTIRYIAKKFDMSIQSVYMTAKRLGLEDPIKKLRWIESRQNYQELSTEESQL